MSLVADDGGLARNFKRGRECLKCVVVHFLQFILLV